MCPTNIFFNRKNGDNLFELRPTPVSEKSQIWLLQHIPHMCFFVGRMLNWLLFFQPSTPLDFDIRVLPMESNGFIPCDEPATYGPHEAHHVWFPNVSPFRRAFCKFNIHYLYKGLFVLVMLAGSSDES